MYQASCWREEKVNINPRLDLSLDFYAQKVSKIDGNFSQQSPKYVKKNDLQGSSFQ